MIVFIKLPQVKLEIKNGTEIQVKDPEPFQRIVIKLILK